MFGNANQVRSSECNQTADQGLRNFTDELCEALLDYINVTSQPDVNITEEIDSFYFYEVSFLFLLNQHVNSKDAIVCTRQLACNEQFQHVTLFY
ncbi:hypothetical protein EAG_07244 [Camponotus floridanus]|uniref:Uncharacterized protein n=1 Tax=Camponotus floridanus TaxID=104421 RepID=E2AMN7_CAMFO|nr:hypothetical protein EAG_07244 [Camponotus floridanus]